LATSPVLRHRTASSTGLVANAEWEAGELVRVRSESAPVYRMLPRPQFVDANFDDIIGLNAANVDWPCNHVHAGALRS
jgi:hypothetical protein